MKGDKLESYLPNGKNDNHIELSVIVPVYNVEEYLQTCIDSLLKLHQIRIEIILINDGSTDNSGSIADKYAMQDCRIKVIHQENRGIPAARNAGLTIAKGVYIVFVNGDDWIIENSLCELFYTAFDRQADVIMGNFQYYFPDGDSMTLSISIPDVMYNTLLSGNTSYTLPEHQMERLRKDLREMSEWPQKVCKSHFLKAEKSLKKYTDWLTSEWVTLVAHHVKAGKKLMLIFNTIQDNDWNGKGIPSDWVVTTDRRYFPQADAVVFHIPSLFMQLDHDLTKSNGQFWISWYPDSDKNNSLITDPEISDLFDRWIFYRENEDMNFLDGNYETTYEGHRITSTAERIKLYGQCDHLRVFGNDFEKILVHAGFTVEIVYGDRLPAEIVAVIGPANYDDNRIYICRKFMP